MTPEDATLNALFSQQITQFSVPHYQRPQAWDRDKHWAPLWADIEAKANEWVGGRQPRQHYLGAIVLAKRPKPGNRGIDRILVIDGQQRLSTLQYIYKALHLLAQQHQATDAALGIEQSIFNPLLGTMDQPAVQKHKVWPTFRDRKDHERVMNAATVEAIRELYPSNFTQQGKLRERGEHPRPLACTLYFLEEMRSWLQEFVQGGEAARGIESIQKALGQSLQIVALWLSDHDDPQLIFECLNGRGEPLRPTDLIKNYLFMNAEQNGECGALSEEGPLFSGWSLLDTEHWSKEIPRGRITKTRLEWLIYYALQAETGQEVDLSAIYAAYKIWAPNPPTGQSPTAQAQVERLIEHSKAFAAFEKEEVSTPIGRFGILAQGLDVTTVTPLVLAINRHAAPEHQEPLYGLLESYLIRRAVAGWGTKAYNHVFLTALRALRERGFQPEHLKAHLAQLSGRSHAWPDDTQFADALQTNDLYGTKSPVCRILLTRCANAIARQSRGEQEWSPNWKTLHIEHLMPRSWSEHWPLQDGSTVTPEEIDRANALVQPNGVDEKTKAIQHRQSLLNKIGNLTVLKAELNIALQNKGWEEKKVLITENTNLQMNFSLVKLGSWSEIDIQERGRALARILCTEYPGP